MNIAIILAGGIGSRVGADRPKQFIEVLGKPILVYTIEKFHKMREIDAIEIVSLSSHLEYVKELKEKYKLAKVTWITEGGATFQESVMKGVFNLDGKISDDDTVLIHFGASPFVEDSIIHDAIRVCGIHGNAISSTDFFILSGKKKKTSSVSDPENFSSEYIDRDSVACMSTPHAFRFGFVRDLYSEAIKTGMIHKVEPHTTTLMYAMSKTVYFSLGSQTNIKITRQEDVDLFEGYVLMKQKRGEI